MKTLSVSTQIPASRVNKLNGLILSASALALALAVAPVSAKTLGLVADNSTKTVTVFDTDTDTVLGSVALPTVGSAVGDVLVTPDQKLGFVTNFNSEIYVIDLSGPVPVLASGTNPIPISNPGEDLSLSPNGKFLLVSDGSALVPISVIDIATRTEIHTFATGSDSNSLDVCSDGSVLATSFNSGNVRRLTLDGAGVLTDTGEVLAVDSPMNVYCAPGAKSGVVVNFSNNTVQSFAIPGLTPVDTRTLSGGNGISGVVDPAGDRVCVRSNGEGGVVDAFSFNKDTATLGATPLFSIYIDNTPQNFFGMDQMALANGKLYIPEFNALNVYNAGTGGLLTSITDPNIVAPTGVAVTAVGICDGNPPEGAIVGTDRRDILTGTPGDDIIFGLGGSDIIRGMGGNDIICGGPGTDYLAGGSGNDQIFGGDGSDILGGGSGDDMLSGGKGSDTLNGGSGKDTLNGGDDMDVLLGVDFVNGNDTLDGGDEGKNYCYADVGDAQTNCNPW